MVRRYENQNGNIYIGGTRYSEFMTARVIGEFVCDAISPITFDRAGIPTLHYLGVAKNWTICMTAQEAIKYCGDTETHGLFGWHISDLVIYDTPKELSEFWKWSDGLDDLRPCQNGKLCRYLVYDYIEGCQACAIDFDGTDCPFLKVTRPPQGWCYVEVLT